MEMKKYFVVFVTMCISISMVAQTDLFESFEFNGEERTYRLHIPPQYEEGGESLPLVFNLHGAGSNALEQALYTSFNVVSNTEGFFVCHPNGTPQATGGNVWNVNFPGSMSEVDDVGFILALIDLFKEEYNINLSRTYSTGMSNGGFLSYKLACEHPDKIAAIASVTGSMVPSELSVCNPGKAVPVMQIHGTNDLIVLYNGSLFSSGIEELVSWWVNNNGCDTEANYTEVEDTDPDDGSTAELFEYVSCDDDVTVEFYKIADGGHTWPGAPNVSPELLGITNNDFNASQVIWEFFNKYQLPETSQVDDLFGLNAIQVFPNPTENRLQFTTESSDVIQYKLMDSSGAKLLQGHFTKTQEIHLEAFANGMYILHFESEQGVMTKKILKQ